MIDTRSEIAKLLDRDPEEIGIDMLGARGRLVIIDGTQVEYDRALEWMRQNVSYLLWEGGPRHVLIHDTRCHVPGCGLRLHTKETRRGKDIERLTKCPNPRCSNGKRWRASIRRATRRSRLRLAPPGRGPAVAARSPRVGSPAPRSTPTGPAGAPFSFS